MSVLLSNAALDWSLSKKFYHRGWERARDGRGDMKENDKIQKWGEMCRSSKKKTQKLKLAHTEPETNWAVQTRATKIAAPTLERRQLSGRSCYCMMSLAAGGNSGSVIIPFIAQFTPEKHQTEGGRAVMTHCTHLGVVERDVKQAGGCQIWGRAPCNVPKP